MDRHRFDELSKQIGQTGSRRGLLQVLLGLLLGLLGGQRPARASEDGLCIRNGRPCLFDRQCCSGFCDGRIVCRNGGPGKKRNRKNKPNKNKPNQPNRKHKPNRKNERCRDSERRCDGRCLDVRTDRRHCGRCDNACPATVPCQNGICRCDVCPDGCAFTSVQAAVTAASSGATITICAGTYTEEFGVTILDKDLTLIGAGAGATRLTVDSDSTQPIITIGNGATVRVRDLTVTGARENSGIQNFGSTLTLTGCVVADNNYFSSGGGIFNNGTLTLIDCVVANNQSNGSDGGGIDNRGPLTLRRTAIRNNTAFLLGGGIHNTSPLTIEAGSSVTGNTAEGSAGGGGIFNNGTLTIAPGVTFANNEPDNCAGPGSGTAACPS